MEPNEQQQAAIRSPYPVNIVSAGPGAGKTATLVRRVEHICTNGIARPEKVVVLTYTNGAAHELATRIRALGIRPGFVGTLHGYCFRLLQKYGRLLGYRERAISLIGQEEAKTLIKATIARLKAKVSTTTVWEGLRNGAFAGDAKLVWQEYQHLLKRNNMVDYDRILECGRRLFDFHEVRETEACDEVLVDETQDSTVMDLLIYEAFPTKSRFLIGDGDQSIFGFRGGGADMDEEDGTRFTLDRCYRSDVRICEAASRLIAHNPNRTPKRVIPVTSEQGSVEVRAFVNSDDEARWIADRLRRENDNQATPFSQMAVIARTNAIVDSLRDHLTTAGIPLARQTQAEMPKDWSTALLALSLALDPENDIHMEEWLNAIRIDPRKILVFKQMATTQGTSLAYVCGFRSPAGLGEIGVWLNQNGISRESIDLIDRRMALLPQDDPTLADLLQDLWKHEDWNASAQVDGVRVSTIHAAKGTEADLVIVAGCEEGNLPKLTKSADIEEERRMMFVAVTRARHTLFLTHCTNRTVRWGQTGPLAPSRFLEELL